MLVTFSLFHRGSSWPSSDSQGLVANTGPIWMDHVHCNGNETSIEDCAFDGWGNHTCTHNEAVRLRCYDSKYSKTCLKRPLKIDKTKILMTNGSFMKVESIAKCSPWSILKYF